jgi:cyclin B
MTTRVFSNISNLPIAQAEGKRMTRATRKVLGELPVHNQQKTQNILPASGKENVVDNMCKGQKKVRQTKVAARRLNLVQQDEVPMEVEQVEELAISRVLPIGVKDIDADDASNPQLCSEYALETFAYLKQLEKRGSVKPEYLSGCPTSDKMRAVLVDWLVEVQIQFKLLQETLFLTVNTIDR